MNTDDRSFPQRMAGLYRHPRVDVASRTLAAILGGYLLAASSASLVGLALPIERSQAVLTGMLAAIVVYACAALWAFAVRTALRAWLGIGLPAALMSAAVFWLRPAA